MYCPCRPASTSREEVPAPEHGAGAKPPGPHTPPTIWQGVVQGAAVNTVVKMPHGMRDSPAQGNEGADSRFEPRCDHPCPTTDTPFCLRVRHGWLSTRPAGAPPWARNVPPWARNAPSLARNAPLTRCSRDRGRRTRAPRGLAAAGYRAVRSRAGRRMSPPRSAGQCRVACPAGCTTSSCRQIGLTAGSCCRGGLSSGVAVGETVILLHPHLPLVVVAI